MARTGGPVLEDALTTGAGRSAYKSSGARPVCFAIRDSIRGPSSSESRNANTKFDQLCRDKTRWEPLVRFISHPLRSSAARTRRARVLGQELTQRRTRSSSDRGQPLRVRGDLLRLSRPRPVPSLEPLLQYLRTPRRPEETAPPQSTDRLLLFRLQLLASSPRPLISGEYVNLRPASQIWYQNPSPPSSLLSQADRSKGVSSNVQGLRTGPRFASFVYFL